MSCHLPWSYAVCNCNVGIDRRNYDAKSSANAVQNAVRRRITHCDFRTMIGEGMPLSVKDIVFSYPLHGILIFIERYSPMGFIYPKMSCY